MHPFRAEFGDLPRDSEPAWIAILSALGAAFAGGVVVALVAVFCLWSA